MAEARAMSDAYVRKDFIFFVLLCFGRIVQRYVLFDSLVRFTQVWENGETG